MNGMDAPPRTPTGVLAPFKNSIEKREQQKKNEQLQYQDGGNDVGGNQIHQNPTPGTPILESAPPPPTTHHRNGNSSSHHPSNQNQGVDFFTTVNPSDTRPPSSANTTLR